MSAEGCEKPSNASSVKGGRARDDHSSIQHSYPNGRHCSQGWARHPGADPHTPRQEVPAAQLQVEASLGDCLLVSVPFSVFLLSYL